jgi:hypothetical protein
MQVLYERCCGLDVHKKTVVACVLITSADGQVHKQVRTAATTTAGLLALADWLAALQISHVAHDAYRDLLAARVQFAGRGTYDHFGQRPAYEGCPRAQDGHQGCGVDRRSVTAWFTQGQFHSLQAHP